MPVLSKLVLAFSAANAAVASFPSVVHYPPLNSTGDDLTFAINGTGAPGIFNSSFTPDDIYSVTYNWCNMPHVRTKEYKVADSSYKLEYVELIHRHHKRTPYASNIFPNGAEDILWNCDGEGPATYGKNATGPGSVVLPIQWSAFTSPNNPFTTIQGFNGSNCQFPQISADGIADSWTHGFDLASVYKDKLGFLPAELDPNRMHYRVTNNVITSQVAGGLIKAMYPDLTGYQVLIQSSSFDSLEPAYSCPAANAVNSQYQGANSTWAQHLQLAAPVYDKLDAVSNIPRNDTGGWHVSFDHYYDNLSAKQCHGFPLPRNVNNTDICVDQDLANTVYRLGNWEYAYNFRLAQNSTLYSAGDYGAWILELKANLDGKVAGTNQDIYRHNIAHDGSVAPLMGALQVANGYWPGMGTEVVFELYSKSNSWFIRVLIGGQPMQTSTPMGTLDMVDYNTFHTYLESLVGTNGSELFAWCNGD
ncbi:histidine phosphatase [Calocera viscosa TUFC12733]|uniref:Histidine phosphatase n=1 Tax=Calocera viscosa (strain TUFC12733) TaxID=1330018 RepID=A0A167FXG2_CALVF|nr:histidine phosphatase [Calocera viscosa TUFC12733]